MAGAGLLWVLLCTPSLANEQWYALEFVVFARTQPELSGEHWPAFQRDNAGFEAHRTSTGLPAQTDSWPALAERRLSGVADRLNESPAFRVLLHSGWRQTLHSRARTRPVPVAALFDPRLARTGFAGPGPDPEPIAPGRLTDEGAARLSGTLRLFTTQYLRIEADLTYAAEVPSSLLFSAGEAIHRDTPAAPGHQLQWQQDPRLTQAWAALRLQETRGAQLGDLHYFDHPAFGMITQVRRSEPPLTNTTVPGSGNSGGGPQQFSQ